jgi:hypothetical protein
MGSIRRLALVGCVVAIVAAPIGSAAAAAPKTKGDPVTIMTIGEFEVAAAGSANPEVSGAVEAPALTSIDPDDPLVEGIDLSEVVIATTQRLDPGTATVVVAANDVPLLVRGSVGGVPFAVLGFALPDTNLQVVRDFPVLLDRLLTSLAGAALPPSDLVVGDALPVDPIAGGAVVAPGGTTTEVVPGGPIPTASRPGFWTVAAAEATGTPDRTVAVNADPAESDIAPASALLTPARQTQPGDAPRTGRDSLRAWVVWPLLAVLVAEWLVARRRRGVGRGQWRAAVALRVAIAALLVVPSCQLPARTISPLSMRAKPNGNTYLPLLR